MTRKNLLTTIVVVAIAVLVAIAWYFWSGSSGNNDLLANTSGGYAIRLTDRDRPMGSPKAPILMVEYAAPTCPVCARFDLEIFPLLKQKYIDTGKVYYIYRVFPLSAVDVAAEGIARCLPNESYFNFIDMLYHSQDQWDPDGHDIPDVHAALVGRARIAGMSAEKADACINDADQQKKTTAVGTEAETNYGIDSTPTFIVNGQKRLGVSTWADWQNFLDTMLHAKK